MPSAFIRVPRFLLTVVTVLCSAFCAAADTSSYMNAKSFCADPLGMENTYMNGAWFHKYLDLKYVHVSQEVGYVQLTKPEYDEIASHGSQGELLESYLLTMSNAQTLRNKLVTDSSNSVVPVTAKMISFLAAYAGSPANIATGAFLKYLIAQDNLVKVQARDLAQVIADGGRINRLLAITAGTANKGFLVNTFVYAVDVAKEHREYATTSCTYAIKIDYAEFDTQASQNNKIIRRVSENKWNVIDVDTNRVEQVLFETARDDDFIYLNENDPNSRINNAHRFSLNGGPWQMKVSGNWATLTSTIVAR